LILKHKQFMLMMNIQRLSIKTRVVLISGIVVALILGGIGVFLMLQKKAPPLTPTNKAIDTSLALIEDSKYSEAEEALRKQIKLAKDKKDIYDLQSELGRVCYLKKDYDCAIEAYKAAEANSDLLSPMALGLAQAYEAKGDKKLAIEQYEKVRDMVSKSEDPDVVSSVGYYDEKIKELKAAK
jgi:tetratricopeptide (TPR) repeat protein